MPSVEKRLDALLPIEGSPPSLLNPPPGCPFHPRCKYRFEPCDTKRPPLVQAIPGGHLDACLLSPERKREIWQTGSPARSGRASVERSAYERHRPRAGPATARSSRSST